MASNLSIINNRSTCNTSLLDCNQSNRSSSTKFLIEVILHSVIFVLGTLGNTLVVIVICRRGKSTKCTTTWLVLNLAIADLGITLFNIPMSNIYHFTGWPFGRNLCKYFLGAFGESIVGVSVFTHASLALVRFHVVLHPIRCVIKLRRVQIGIAAIWLLAYTSLSAPLTSILDLVYSSEVNGHVCRPQWPSFQYRISYRSCVIILTYVIPMMLASYCYIKIYKALKSSMSLFRSDNASSATHRMRREYKSKRLTKALFILYIFFTVTTLPLEIFYFLIDLQVLPDGTYLAHAWSSFLALFYGLSVINPIMLFYISEEYRYQLYNLFHQCSNTREKNANDVILPKSKHVKSKYSNTQQDMIHGDSSGNNGSLLKKNDVIYPMEICLIKMNASKYENESNDQSLTHTVT